ncbi:hypothetical protein BU17DRAFT_30480, partial [Hysterangium stoloniferum]
LSAPQVVSQSHWSCGFFSFLRVPKAEFQPTYNYEPDMSTCRVYSSLEVRKSQYTNLHVTTLGHRYGSGEH